MTLIDRPFLELYRLFRKVYALEPAVAFVAAVIHTSVAWNGAQARFSEVRWERH